MNQNRADAKPANLGPFSVLIQAVARKRALAETQISNDVSSNTAVMAGQSTKLKTHLPGEREPTFGPLMTLVLEMCRRVSEREDFEKRRTRCVSAEQFEIRSGADRSKLGLCCFRLSQNP